MTHTPKRFIVRDTVPCNVSWFYEIEAENEDDAYEQHCDGSMSAPVAVEIGDSLDWAGSQETAVVDEIPITATKEALSNAASELLEALEAIQRRCQPHPRDTAEDIARDRRHIENIASAAIAKARGQ